MASDDPLEALIRMRAAILAARSATDGYGYEEFNIRMRALRIESYKLFALFDEYYSAPDADEEEDIRQAQAGDHGQ